MSGIPGQLLIDEATLDDPYPFYRRLLAEAPVWRPSEDKLFVVSSYALVTEATRRVEDFSSNMRHLIYRDDAGLPFRHEHGMGADLYVLATADPPVHAAHRKLLMPSFTPARLARLETMIASLSERLVRDALASGKVEFMSRVANLLPMEIVIALVDFRDADANWLLKTVFGSMDILAGAISLDAMQQAMSLSVDTGVWAAAQLQSAMTEPRDGILSDLVTGIRDGVIDHMSAIAMLQILLSAGAESTTSILGNAVQFLAADQALQQQIRENPALIPAFIEEVLRLESPFRYHMRWVPKDTTLGGVQIPAGATLLLMWGAANRDPAQFDNPDAVNLDRPRRHVTFGSGIHTCIGNSIARMEARLILQNLLAMTRSIELDPGAETERVRNLAVRRFDKLPVMLTAA
jgi:cytochrome P450